MTTMDQQYPMGPAEYPPDPPGPQAGTFPRGAKKTQCESPTCSLSTLSPSMVSSSSSRSSTSSIMSLDQGHSKIDPDFKSSNLSSAVIGSKTSDSTPTGDHPDLQNLSIVASGSILKTLKLSSSLWFFWSSVPLLSWLLFGFRTPKEIPVRHSFTFIWR